MITKRQLKLFEMQLLSLINKSLKQLSQNLLQTLINTEPNLKLHLQKRNDKIENPDLHQVNENDHNLMIAEKDNRLKTDLKLEYLIILKNLRNLKHQKWVKTIIQRVQKFDRNINITPSNQYCLRKKIMRRGTQSSIKKESTEDIQWTHVLQPQKDNLLKTQSIVNLTKEKAIHRINLETTLHFSPQLLQILKRRNINSVVQIRNTNQVQVMVALLLDHLISNFETKMIKFLSNLQQFLKVSTVF